MIETHLADGTAVTVRPVRPEDKELLIAGMERLSERSRHQRFLVATERLSRRQLAYLTEVDGRNHQAWGILAGEEPVGIGRFIRDGDEAEVALTVIDDWQRRGVGLLLLRVLADEAAKVGIKRFLFVALAENHALTGLLAHFGVTGEIEDGLLVARVSVNLIREQFAELRDEKN